MKQEQFDTGKAPEVFVESCFGDLSITVAHAGGTQIAGDDFTVKEVDSSLYVNSTGDLRLRLPAGSTLRLEDIKGDLTVRQVQGSVSIQKVGGDASLSKVGDVKLSNVHGDLVAKHMTGSLSVEAVGGDAVINYVTGDVNMGSIGGDLAGRYLSKSATILEVSGDVDLKMVAGDVRVEKSSRDVNLAQIGGEVAVLQSAGDIRLSGSLSSGNHELTAGGDIVLRWPPDAPLNLVATASSVTNRMRFDSESEKEDGTLVGTIGEGNTNVMLNASGRIILKEAEASAWAWDDPGMKDLDQELEGLGERITAQVEEHMAKLAAEMEMRFGDLGTQVSDKIVRKAEKAAERAAAKAERAQKRAGRYGGFAPPPPPSIPAPPKKQASTEEQMKILRMVESGAITPEDANMLLEALES